MLFKDSPTSKTKAANSSPSMVRETLYVASSSSRLKAALCVTNINLRDCVLQMIPSGQSKRFYELLAYTLSHSGELLSETTARTVRDAL